MSTKTSASSGGSTALTFLSITASCLATNSASEIFCVPLTPTARRMASPLDGLLLVGIFIFRKLMMRFNFSQKKLSVRFSHLKGGKFFRRYFSIAIVSAPAEMDMQNPLFLIVTEFLNEAGRCFYFIHNFTLLCMLIRFQTKVLIPARAG